MNFKQQVTAQIADAESGDPEEYRGQDWWQLMPEEELVFDIDFRRFPRSITAFMAFESFHDIVAPEEEGMVDKVEAAVSRAPLVTQSDLLGVSRMSSHLKA